MKRTAWSVRFFVLSLPEFDRNIVAVDVGRAGEYPAFGQVAVCKYLVDAHMHFPACTHSRARRTSSALAAVRQLYPLRERGIQHRGMCGYEQPIRSAPEMKHDAMRVRNGRRRRRGSDHEIFFADLRA